MIIAAHIQQTKGFSTLLLPYLSRIAAAEPTAQFMFFCEDPSVLNSLPGNCQTVLIKRPLKNSLLLHYWFNYVLPKQLKKHGAHIFISENNVCSLRTTVPQLMLIKENFIAPTSPGNKKLHVRYLKKYFPVFATTAVQVCTTSPRLSRQLATAFPILKNKISNIFHGLDEQYQPMNEQQQNDLLDKHTEGHHFFVCECNAQNRTQLVTVLKAFSIFKKRLKSSMQLVLLNKLGENPIPDFHLYKYRQEVKLLNNMRTEEEAGLIAAAYAALEINSSLLQSDWALHCMQAEVPVVSLEAGGKQRYEDAAIYTPLDEKLLADELMLLYKDENHRKQQITRGKSFAAPYNWPQSSQLFWQSILQSVRD